ncbi:MAG: hypothetical protein FJZ95_00215 [Chloroflexi bacterium]|nr:hypothetical protein [Chloroflexota bacterium]
MAIWVSSDWHCEPGKLKGAVAEWIKRGKEGNHRLIAAGDLFDILPLGKKHCKNPDSIKELAAILDGYTFEYVAGNHDPYGTMKKLLAPYPNIKLLKRLEIEDSGRKYYITHGHQWAIDWGYLGLRRVAPRFVEFMVRWFPSLWYRICRWRGWLARPGAAEKTPGKESQHITKLTRIIWGGAADHALRKNCCVILGHTHTVCRHERALSREEGFQAYVLDDGDLTDGTYVEIRGKEARPVFLA